MPKEKTNKTNACRILDQKKVPYELISYEVDEVGKARNLQTFHWNLSWRMV